MCRVLWGGGGAALAAAGQLLLSLAGTATCTLAARRPVACHSARHVGSLRIAALVCVGRAFSFVLRP